MKRDAPFLFQLVQKNRIYLRRWLPWVDGVERVTDSRNFILSTKQGLRLKKRVCLGIWHQEKLVGVIELRLMADLLLSSATHLSLPNRQALMESSIRSCLQGAPAGSVSVPNQATA